MRIEPETLGLLTLRVYTLMGGSRIFLRGRATPKVGCRKIKEFGPRGVPGVPMDPAMHSYAD